jgi:hypothetical protein
MSSDEWAGLADRVAGSASDYLAGLDAVATGEGGDETIPMLLLEVSQILLAGAQVGASRDIILPGNWEPPVGGDPDLDALRQTLAARIAPIDAYVEVFDPFATETQVTTFRLADDLVDIAADLSHGLMHHRAGRPMEALWWWQYSYFNHWGTHAGAALRALHAVVAHTRLDVDENAVS